MQARIKTMYTYGADLLANAVLLVPAHGTAALQHCWPLVICSNSQVSLGKWRYTKEAMHPRTHWKTMGRMLMFKDGKNGKLDKYGTYGKYGKHVGMRMFKAVSPCLAVGNTDV